LRRIPTAAIAATLATVVLPAVPAGAQVLPRPNVIVILTDDQRVDQFTGMSTVAGELSAKGTTFSNAFVVDPYCCPSRISALRGQYSHSTGIYGASSPYGGAGLVKSKGLENSTLATWLDSVGYRTSLIGKYLNGYSNTSTIPPGWDDWKAMAKIGSGERYYYNYSINDQGSEVQYGSSSADYSTDVLRDYAVDFIKTTPEATPFFLWFAVTAPHSPRAVAPRHESDPRCSSAANTGYLGGTGPPPSWNEADVSDKPLWIRQTSVQSSGKISTQKSQWIQACRTLLSVDEAVKALINSLGSRLANTMIIFTSDNGHMWGEHRIGGKKVAYEETARVPFIVRYDPLTGMTARSDSRMVANIDIAATVAEAAGVAPGVPQDGRSLMPLLQGSSQPWRDAILIEHADPPGSTSGGYVPTYCAIRTTTHKYVAWTTGEEELYDLQTDPYELNNLLRPPGGVISSASQALRVQLYERLFAGGGGQAPMCYPEPPDYARPPPPTGGGGDTQPPTSPVLQAQDLGASGVKLTWTEATDNVGVVGYEVLRNGSIIATPGLVLTYTDATVPQSGNFTYAVRAFDLAGNRTSSNEVVVTRSGPPPPPSQSLFADGFESGMGQWSPVVGVVAAGTLVRSGSLAARLASSGPKEFARRNLGTTETSVRARFWVNVVSRDPSKSTLLARVQGPGGTGIVRVLCKPDGRLQYMVESSSTWRLGTSVLPTNGWHLIELEVTTGTSGRVRVFLNGTVVPGLDNVENLGTGGVGQFQIGSHFDGQAFDIAIDDVEVLRAT
jgi:arylsulfatase A-like enzyme